MGIRRRGRECALQVLYTMDVTGMPLKECWESFGASRKAPEKAVSFARELAEGVRSHLKEIDAAITRHAENWELSRMAAVDRNILRLAAYELLFSEDIPPKVAINEAVELAKAFSTAVSSKFVNGILDKIKTDKEAQIPLAGSKI